MEDPSIERNSIEQNAHQCDSVDEAVAEEDVVDAQKYGELKVTVTD